MFPSRYEHRGNRGNHRAPARPEVVPTTDVWQRRGRTTEGQSKLEIIRCLKRYLAREVYYLLNPAAPASKGGGSRARRAGTMPAHAPLPEADAGSQGQGSAARPTAQRRRP